MSIKQHPSQKTLRSIFKYNDEGFLTHRPRKDVLGRTNVRYAGKKAGCLDSKGRWRIVLHRIPYEAHRIIWVWHNGEIPKNCVIDHIDGNPLNNRIGNLRIATTAENNANRHRKTATATSKYFGVSWNKNRNKWVAQAKKESEVKYIGIFDSEKEAAKARDSYVRGLHNGFEKLNFPSKLNEYDLHGYQKKAAEFVVQKPKCALWISLGLGKTAITITALSSLFNTFEIGKVLIIAPLRVAKHTWPDELDKWQQAENLSHCVLAGKPARERLRLAQYDRSDIHLINRENVKWLVDEMRKNWKYDTVIIDESSSFKSPSAQRFKALKKVLPSIDRLVELTGTPASNGLLDIYSQIYLIDQGERLGKTMTAYKSRYFDSDYMGYNFTIREGADEKIYKKIDDIVLRLDADDYLKMPARFDNNIDVHLPRKAADVYRELEKEFIVELESDTVTALSAAALTGKLLQCGNGALYVNEDGGYQTLHDEKLDALEEIVAETGEPILVAYNFKSDLARLKSRFPKAATLDEKNAMKRWNDGKIEMLLAHPASAGHGLNLQKGGNVIVWFGLNWSLELYQQFNGRLHRQGQEKPVVIHHVVAKDTVDETVLAALTEKNITQKALLDALKTDIELRG